MLLLLHACDLPTLLEDERQAHSSSARQAWLITQRDAVYNPEQLKQSLVPPCCP